MSHEHGEIICPNCGYHAVENYCARCGQETHLHKETFWGLVMHFLGHYFHYDSKFWQTMKALWFSPGKLTIAYWNKQRNRYISPVSLYIFISAVYFLISFEMPGSGDIQVNNQVNKKGLYFSSGTSNGDITFTKDTTSTIGKLDSSEQKLVRDAIKNNVKTTNGYTGIDRWFNNKFSRVKKKHEDFARFINDAVEHTLPKIFFFMIPVMALFLKMLYAKRKDLFFVDHAIFALHFHSFWFSTFMLRFLFLFPFLNFGGFTYGLVVFGLIIVAIRYMVKALRSVYGSGRWKARIYMLILAMGYSLAMGILFLLDLLLILYTA